MNCDEVQGFLNAYIDDELDAGRRTRIDSHLRECSSCRSFLQKLENVRDHLRDGRTYHAAPAALRERVRFAIRGAEYLEPRPRGVDWRLWGAAAATILVAAGVSAPFLVQARAQRQLISEELFSAHARALMGHEMDVISTDRHTVKPWFNGKASFSPPVVDLAAEGFPLEGGRLDYAGGRPVAVLVYRRALHRIDVFVWPAKGSEPAPEEGNRDGFNEISWSQAGFTFAAVSDLNRPELNRFRALLQSR